MALFAQEKKTTTVRVFVGDDVNELLSTSRFLFTDFQNATFSSTEGVGQAMMNYNMLADEMMFIDDKGDTLALNNPKEINMISFGKRKFLHTQKGYVEMIAYTGDKALLKGARIKPAAIKHYGAYGMSNDIASIEEVSAIPDRSEKIGVAKQVTYKVTTSYYIQLNNSLRMVNRKNFEKSFKNKPKGAIAAFIKDNDLDLDKESDIIKLFVWCSEEE
jgi:hypothetical protein